ncbi:MAG: hypothetical protein M3Y72_03840, partial [Acidobacteriota bacterium]|nr:hypothetical protein [Acidobacteriota bacterium]
MAMRSDGVSLFLIEFGLVALSASAAFIWPVSRSSHVHALSRAFNAIAARRGVSVFLIGICAIVMRLLALPFAPLPKPFIEDDFSFLLAADTFASGRLTNATPAMWTHFESFHITMLPTYMSMYFPAQGMAMAAGKVLLGDPWFGVLVTTALMCAALCWMLQAWLPPKWALLGGFLAILRLGLFSYWINTYTGGSIAALGGALVLGALPRILKAFQVRDFFWMALGMALLGNSRPYEGLLICVPAIAFLFWKFRTNPHPGFHALSRRAAPALLLLLGTVMFMGYYNYRVFGNVLTPPYKVNRDTYAIAPHFLWQQPRPEPVYRHKVIHDFYAEWELEWFNKSRTLGGLVEMNSLKLVRTGSFFLGFALLLPLIMLPRALRDRRIRILVWIGLVFVAGLGIETWLFPHYLAPFTPILYAILLQCMRHMQAWRYAGRRPGVFLIRAIPAICVLLCVVRLYANPLQVTLAPDASLTCAWFGTRPLGLERARVLSDLEKQPGKQLVLVRYSAKHDVVTDWVYNAADINASKV